MTTNFVATYKSQPNFTKGGNEVGNRENNCVGWSKNPIALRGAVVDHHRLVAQYNPSSQRERQVWQPCSWRI